MFRKALTAVAVAAVVASTAIPALAITGGETDGEEHPNVGLVLFYSEDGDTNARFRCSGTLVTPTVVITAAHCTEGTVGKTLVTFESEIAEKAPSGLPRASDDEGDGTSDIGFTASQAGGQFSFYPGTAETHPDYSDFTDMRNWNDVGVIVLDDPVVGIVPAKLAPEGYLNDYAQPLLNKTYFTLVGYGTEVRKPDDGPQKPTPMSYPLVRRMTLSNGQKLTDQIVQMNGNPANVIAGGGTCFGDSGGPSFLNDKLVTVTSYGYTSNCRYIGGYQRVDIPVVQDWLAEWGVTPPATP
jgi:hypothetical protein